jgi:hypothetical protein
VTEAEREMLVEAGKAAAADAIALDPLAIAIVVEAALTAVLPLEPTQAMVDAGTEARWRSAVRDADNVREIWRAMCAALTPKEPT